MHMRRHVRGSSAAHARVYEGFGIECCDHVVQRRGTIPGHDRRERVASSIQGCCKSIEKPKNVRKKLAREARGDAMNTKLKRTRAGCTVDPSGRDLSETVDKFSSKQRDDTALIRLKTCRCEKTFLFNTLM